MTARLYQAHGQSFTLRANRKLDVDDYRRLTTLAKLERESRETREAVAGFTEFGAHTEFRKLTSALERQSQKIQRMRQELQDVLA